MSDTVTTVTPFQYSKRSLSVLSLAVATSRSYNTNWAQALVASFPGLSRFCSSVCVPLPCIILNANRRTKNGGGLGTRLSTSPLTIVRNYSHTCAATIRGWRLYGTCIVCGCFKKLPQGTIPMYTMSSTFEAMQVYIRWVYSIKLLHFESINSWVWNLIHPIVWFSVVYPVGHKASVIKLM